MKKLLAAVSLLCLCCVLLLPGCNNNKEPAVSNTKTTQGGQTDSTTGSTTETSGTGGTDGTGEPAPTGPTDGGNETPRPTEPVDPGSTTPPGPEVTSEDIAYVSFGEKLTATNMTVQTPDGEPLKNGTTLGKEYWQLMAGSSGSKTISFTLEPSFIQRIGSRDVVFIVEYYANSANEYSFSYTSDSAVKTLEYEMGTANTWSGKNIRVSDFKPGGGLDGSHFKIELGSALKQMRIASMKVVLVEKETTKYPHIVETDYDTNGYVVAEENVKYYGAVGDGETDDTYAFHTAIQAAKEKGGVVWVPAGTYNITQSIEIPDGVTLMGDFAPPDENGAHGTLLKIFAEPASEENDTAAFRMMAGSALKGMTIWYPEQKLAAGKATPYPYTIEMMEQQGITLENLYLVNSYQGIKMGSNINALQTLRNIYGTTLKTGMYIDHNVDIARFENINLSIDWWLNSKLPGAPSKEALTKWMINNSTAFLLNQIDWAYVSDFTAKGYKIGIHLGANSEGGMGNGQLYRLNITDCNTCVYLECNNYYGYQITESTLSANGGNNPVALRCPSTFVNSVSCYGSKLSSAGPYVVENRGTGSVTLQDCELSTSAAGAKYAVYSEKGKLAASNVTHSGSSKFAYIGEDNKQANLVNCMTQSTLKVDDHSESGFSISYDAADKAAALAAPETPYAQKPTKPGTNKLFNALDYGVKAEAGDVSASLQKAIDAAAAAGGGVVYVPNGIYRLDNRITVKSGVEILGSMDNPHHTKITSTVFFTDYGKNSPDGEALITLQSKAGLRGFTVFYDKQSTADILPYAYTIRGAGSDIYIVNVTLSYTYQGIDLKTNRCDNYYIEGAAFGALKNGITVGGGSTGGLIRDVQANIHYISDNWFEGAERDVTKVLDYNHQNLEGFVISTTSKQTMFNNFIFGAWHGIALVDEADAYIIGHGTDSGIKSVYLNSTGSKPINFVNTQLVNLGDGDKNYILADAGFTGTVNFYNTNVWGIPSNAVVVNSGSLNLISGTFFECGGAGITVKGGEASISGVYLGKRTLADFNIEQGAAGFRAFGNTYTYTKRIQNEAGIALKGSDCK